MVEENETGVHDEERDKSTETENEDVINRDMNHNKTYTNWNTLE